MPPSGRDRRKDSGLAWTSARFLVRLRWWVIAFWASACLAALFVLPTLSETQGGNDLTGLLPDNTPAVETELRSVEIFGFPLLGRTVLVQRDPDGMSAYAQGRTVVNAVAVGRGDFPDVGPLRGALPITNTQGRFPSSREEGTTAVTYLLFEPTVSLGSQTRTAQRYVDEAFGPRDDFIGITGSVPARAEQGGIIRDHLPAAELLTLIAIVLIVGLAFRSVVAPLVALLTTGVAYVVTLRVSGLVAEVVGFSSPSELEPVVVALLLGVVTDYVVFFLSALRSELAAGGDGLGPATRASARYGRIVGVAGLAVAAGTAALLVAESPFFRALGPALVFTVLTALFVAVTLVPPLMAVLGRWAFWPSDPRRVGPPAEHDVRLTSLLRRLTRSPRTAAVVVAGVVGGLMLAIIPLNSLNLGVSFVGSLPADNGVRHAAASAREGFAPGILSPTVVLIEGEDLDQRRRQLVRFGRSLERQPGVAGVLGPGDVPIPVESGVLVADDGRAARFLVVLDDPALGAAAIDSVHALDGELDELLARSGLGDVRVGMAGDSATASFIVEQTSDDLLRIALAALFANLLMLIVFLRALLAAVLLLFGSLLSLSAALGLTMLVFENLDPGAGLTFYVPFAAAVLLLAFGSDYNIFAVGGIWDESHTRTIPDAIVRVMPFTVKAVLAAGLALAASFGMLAVVPLVPFRQLAFVMVVGILLDVLIVRALLMPALLTLLGPASAWPSKRLYEVRERSRRASRRHRATRAAGPPRPETR